jgi:serine phosphatase RsbU (regulator of sigma subunit)
MAVHMGLRLIHRRQARPEHPEHARLAVRAFRLLCAVYLLLGVVHLVVYVSTDLPDLIAARSTATDAAAAAPDTAQVALRDARIALNRGLGRLGGLVVALLVITAFLLGSRRLAPSRAAVTSATALMMVIVGAVLLASRLLAMKAIPGSVPWGLLDVAILHLAACLIMLGTWQEATLPAAPLLLLWAAFYLMPGAASADLTDRVVVVIVSTAVLVPGAMIAAFRHRRRAEDEQRIELAGQVESFGGELSRARIVHDAMFPQPFTGHVCFEYAYQPIQEIGGDYVHAFRCPETGRATVTLLDVAGHGLAAALTVNRLFGELERIIAEHGSADPGEIMALLNRYICLTMSRHSMFATGTSMSLDPRSGELAWVSAGHPPAFVRRGGGAPDVETLATTTMLLGVAVEQFDARPRTMILHPGDTVIAYTDGAFEARDASGARFGIERLRTLAAFDPPPRNWTKFLAGAVAEHHAGSAEDDVLIASLMLRSLRIGDATVRGAGQAQGAAAADAPAPHVS